MVSALIAYVTLTWVMYYRLFHFVQAHSRMPKLRELVFTPLPINAQVQGLMLSIGGLFLLLFLYQAASGTLTKPVLSNLFTFFAWSLYMAVALRRAIRSLSAKSTA